MKNLDIGYFFYQLAQSQFEESARFENTNRNYSNRCLRRAENAVELAEFFGYTIAVHLQIQGWM